MATTVSAGNSGDFTIPAGKTGVFTTTGECLVRIKAGASGAGFETRRVTSAAELPMGPFTNDVVVSIFSISGTATARSRRLVPAVVYEEDGIQYMGELASAGFREVAAGRPVTISGTVGVGQSLTAVPAPGWQITGGQWYRDASAISGATSLSYTVQPADAGKSISFVPSGIPFKATAGTVPGDANTPLSIFVKQSLRVVDQTPVARLLHRSGPRNSVIVRNTGTTVPQIGFTTNNNNNNNAPSSWTDIAVGDEFYEGDVDHQVWIRAKNAGETVTVQIEVDTLRI